MEKRSSRQGLELSEADKATALFIENLYNEYRIKANISKACDTIEEKLTLKENKILAYSIFARKLMRDKGFNHCNNLLQEAISKHGEISNLINEMGKLKHIVGLYEESNQFLMKAFSSKIKDAQISTEIAYNIGLNYYKLNKFEEAISYFEKSLEYTPLNPDTFNNLGLCYKKLKKYKDAIDFFNKVLQISPNDPDIINNKGLIYFEKNDYETAAENFLIALKYKPEDVEILSNLGNTLAKMEDYSHAWIAFDEALKLNPSNKKIMENYLRCICESRDMKKFDHLLENAKFLSKEDYARINAIGNEYKGLLGLPINKLDKRSAYLNTPKKSARDSKGGFNLCKITQ